MDKILHHLGSIKPCKLWDTVSASTGAGFLPSTVLVINWWNEGKKEGWMDERIDLESQIDFIYYILPKYRLDKKTRGGNFIKLKNSVQGPNSSYYTNWQLKFQKKRTSITSTLWGGHFQVGFLPWFQERHELVSVCVQHGLKRAHKSIGSNPPVTRAHG